MKNHPNIVRVVVAAFVAVVALGVVVPVQDADAAGVAAFPDHHDYEDVLRTTEYVKSITLLHDFVSDARWEFAFTGETAEWLTLTVLPDRETPVTEYLAVSGQLVTLGLKLKVPEDVANGFYSGKVEAIARPLDSSELEETGSGVSGVGSIVPITVSVTGDQNIEGVLVGTAVSNAEEGIPMRFSAEVRNLGNVAITPVLTTEVLLGANEVATLTVNDTEVPPGESRSINGEWDTTNADIGEYLARLNVVFGGIDLGTEELAFTLSPRGSLTRSATIVGMDLNGKVALGGVAQVDVTVRNTGRIEGRAVFQGAILRDDQLIEVVESIPRLILADEVGSIAIFFDVPEIGIYTVRGRVNFDGKDTEEEEFSFEVVDPFVAPVEEPEEPSELPVIPMAAGGGALLLAIGFLIFWRRRRRRVSGSESSPPEPPERKVREHETVS